MRVTKPQLVLGTGCVAILGAVIAAALGWWAVALAIVAVLQGAVLVAILDTRQRMARSKSVRDVSGQAKRANRLIDNVGTRLLAAAETSRVETADRLSEFARSLDENRVAVTSLEKNVTDLTAGLDHWRSEVSGLRSEFETRQDASDGMRDALAAIGAQVSELHAALELDRGKRDKREFAVLSRSLRQTEALVQLYDRISPRRAMPSAGGWGLDPAGLLVLVDLVERRQPRVVLELGSGTSTIWLGYALEKLGSARVISLDHDEKYAARTRELITSHALGDVAEVRTAPLVGSGLNQHDPAWYDLAVVDDVDEIDLLVVDGPPKATGAYARYPALPRLAERLAPGACIAVDDATRTDEKEVIRRWTAEFPGLREILIMPGGDLKVLEHG